MTISTPLLTPPSNALQLAFPRLETDRAAPFEMHTDTGKVRVESVEPYGCILIVASDGARVGPVCNRRLHCLNGTRPPTFPAQLSVYRTSDSGEY